MSWTSQSWYCVGGGCEATMPFKAIKGNSPPEIYREHGWMFSSTFGSNHWEGNCWCPEHEDEALDALSADD